MARSVLAVMSVAVLLAAISAHGEEGEGGYAFSSLERGGAGRGPGMGCAFTAVADDPNALLWNPAGLAQITTREISSTYGALLEGQQQFFLSYAQRYRSLAGAVGWYMYGSGSLQRRDANGNQQGEFGDWEHQFLLGVASPLPFSWWGMRLHAGGVLRVLYHAIESEHGSGLAGDVGLLATGQSTRFLRRYALGIAGQNLGASVAWSTPSAHADVVPAAVRLGSRVGFGAPGVDLVGDLSRNTRQSWKYHLGVEGRYSGLGLRAGTNNGSLGAGGTIHLASTGLSEFDYSFLDDPVSHQGIHRFTVALRF